MRKRLISILCLLILLQFPASAKKSHKSHKKHRSHKQHEILDKRPAMTLEDIKPDENIWGIDVSHYQSDINWEILGEQKPNFMFIKASEGSENKDSKYLTNYTEAKKQGILVGSYHFFSYKVGGKEQANNFLATAQHKNGDLLPVLDAEFIRRMPKKDNVIKGLTDFINTIYEKLGHYPIVYCNNRFYNLYLKEHLQDKCKLWIVDYKTKPQGDWSFWQTTNKFKLAGIRGFVDLNMFNGPMTNMKNFLYHNETD
jgi:lysozyme